MGVLIITKPNDYHAHAVKWAIERLGGRCEFFYALDLCDGAAWSFDPADDVLRIDYKGKRQTLAFDDFQSVWMRRPAGIYAQESIDDAKERAVAEAECLVFGSSMMARIEAGRFTVNPQDSGRQASQKPFQMAVATRVGMPMPKSLVSNSKDEVVSFFEACGRNIVYKAMKPAVWPIQNGGGFTMTPTTLLTDATLFAEADLSRSPSIFQEVINKKVEVRATIMGRSVFAWEKTFSSRDDMDIDWRYMFRGAEHRVHTLPEDIEKKCFEMMEALNLVFGCFDFIIDEDGKYWFLEVNPQGQWLWGDGLDIGLYQLEAMAEFLLSGNPDFKYSGNQSFKISDYNDYSDSVEEEKKNHYGDLTTSMYERVSIRMLPERIVTTSEANVPA